jgi:hypothetical protein
MSSFQVRVKALSAPLPDVDGFDIAWLCHLGSKYFFFPQPSKTSKIIANWLPTVSSLAVAFKCLRIHSLCGAFKGANMTSAPINLCMAEVSMSTSSPTTTTVVPCLGGEATVTVSAATLPPWLILLFKVVGSPPCPCSVIGDDVNLLLCHSDLGGCRSYLFHPC